MLSSPLPCDVHACPTHQHQRFTASNLVLTTQTPRSSARSDVGVNAASGEPDDDPERAAAARVHGDVLQGRSGGARLPPRPRAAARHHPPRCALASSGAGCCAVWDETADSCSQEKQQEADSVRGCGAQT
eukprot:1259547-Rhodomonas_salina.3